MTPHELMAEWANLPYCAMREFPRMARALGYDDAFGYAQLALCEAALRYDPARGVKFVTYAMTCIRLKLIDELRKLYGRGGWKPKVFVQSQLGGPSDEESQVLEATNPTHAGTVSAAVDDADHVGKLLARLSPQERRVAYEHLALGRTIASVARDMDLSESRVYQLRERALRALRRAAA